MKINEHAGLLAQQIIKLLEAIPAEVYARPLEVFNGSTLGQHFRHIFDFYDCLLQGAAACEIDYAARKRDAQLERDPAHARDSFEQLVKRLEGLRGEAPLLIRAEFAESPQQERTLVGSTVGRELMYACDHAIHHLALIRIGLRDAMPALILPAELGVAPSTVQYRSNHH
jgi:uncharacterized damage-inducible protein DinB